MAEEQGLEVSLDGFNKCMEQQRERSRVTLPSGLPYPSPPPPPPAPNTDIPYKPSFKVPKLQIMLVANFRC